MKEVKKTFSFDDIMASMKDSREERIDWIMQNILKSKKIHQMTKIEPKELSFYLQLHVICHVMKFFHENGYKNPEGNIMNPPVLLPDDLKTFMLGLSRSREGWFVENIFKYLRGEEYEREKTDMQNRGRIGPAQGQG